MLLYSEHSHRTHLMTHSQKTQALLLFLVLCLPSSSFKPWVPDLNLNKSLEAMSETPYKYFLALKFKLVYSGLSTGESRVDMKLSTKMSTPLPPIVRFSLLVIKSLVKRSSLTVRLVYIASTRNCKCLYLL